MAVETRNSGGCFPGKIRDVPSLNKITGHFERDEVHRAAREILNWLTDPNQKHGLPAHSLKHTLAEMHEFLLYWYRYRKEQNVPSTLVELQLEAAHVAASRWPRLSREMTDFEARRLWNIYDQSPTCRGATMWTHYSSELISELDGMVDLVRAPGVEEEVDGQQSLKEVLARPSIEQRTPSWYAIRPSTLGASTKAKHTPSTYLGIGWYDFQYGTTRNYGFHPVDGSWLTNLQDKVASGIKKEGENQLVFGPTTAVGRGRMYEPVVGRDTMEMSTTVIHDVGMFVDPIYPFNAVSPDGILEVSGEAASIEFKCPDSDQYATEYPLEKYACQMLSSSYINKVSLLPFVTSHYVECSKESAAQRQKPQLLLKRLDLDQDERYLYPSTTDFAQQQEWAQEQMQKEAGWSVHYYERQKWRSHVLHMTPTMRWIYTHYQVLVDELWYYYIMEGRARPETLGIKNSRVRAPTVTKVGHCLL